MHTSGLFSRLIAQDIQKYRNQETKKEIKCELRAVRIDSMRYSVTLEAASVDLRRDQA